MFHQIMETTPCWYDVSSLNSTFPFHLLHYGTNTPNQPTTYEYLMAWWKTNNGCCRGCGGYYYECNFTFQSKIENHFLRYPFPLVVLSSISISLFISTTLSLLSLSSLYPRNQFMQPFIFQMLLLLRLFNSVHRSYYLVHRFNRTRFKFDRL